MIKKFVSNALLSVVMDKDARKKLQGRREKTPQDGSPDKKAAKKAVPAKSPDDLSSGEDVVDTIAQALAEAREEVANGPSSARSTSRPPPPAQRVSSTRKAPKPSPKPVPSKKAPGSTPERERLIQEAMSIHRQKAHVLDELDPATREKLMVMAMYALDPSSLPPEARKMAEAESKVDSDHGLVDELGTNAGPVRKKPLRPRK